MHGPSFPCGTTTSCANALEDLADREALRAAQANGEEMFPSSLAERLWSGANPVRVWREYRGLSVTDLARQARVSDSQLSAIERGNATGSVQTLRSIADVLDVTLDDLTPVNQDDQSDGQAAPGKQDRWNPEDHLG